MALYDDIRRRTREKHRQKKEEERRLQEEQRRAREAFRPSNPVQSPSKAAAKRTVTLTKQDAVDPMAIMRQIEAKKDSKPKARVADSPSVESNSSMQNGAAVAAKDDMREDPLEVQRRLSREKDAKAPPKDPLEIARMKEEEKRVKQKEESESEEEEESSESEMEEETRPKKARNPLALMERNNQGRRSFSPRGGGNEAWPQGPTANLWDDSEDEYSKAAPSKRKTAAARKKNGETRKPAPKKKGSLKAASRPCSYEDIGDSDSDSEREEALIPTFSNPKLGPPSALEPLKLPRGKDQKTSHEVPASINRYLRGYQQHGVTFLYSCIMRGSGAILGDDMGLGKTVQLISLLASLLGKTGTEKDATDLHQRRRLVSQALREMKDANDEALLTGAPQAVADTLEVEGLTKLEWAPVLVIVPPSVIDNWIKEFKTWGHFGVGVFQGREREQALEKVKNGTNEVLVCGSKLATNAFGAITKVPWKLIIVDEVHGYKNDKSNAYKKLRELRDLRQCPIIGMTGTIMPNNHQELFNLIDLVSPGHLGDKDDFKIRFSQPIKYARTITADTKTIQQSISCNHELDAKLKRVYISRTKEGELGDELPEKDETVLFCEPTKIQKALYTHILKLPDYELLRFGNAPCDCGVNRSLFMGYKQLRTAKERINYQRMHRDDIKRRKKCCYKTPANPNRGSDDQPWILPDAVLWRFQHENDEECVQCPYCIQFPAYNKLYKLSSHAALLLAERDPASLDVGSQGWKDTTKDVAFAKVAIPPEILSELPGGESNPYVRQDGIMNDHARLSGKMEKLDKLLRLFDQGKNRVLLFSHYVKTLNLIQQFVQARGYSYLRLDGSTSTPDRQKLVDTFQSDETIFLFLMSTKAGGLGLNLTAANKVICFDLDFNPSHDEQAQDRAYRIGQTNDVQVIRLISQGTIEEQKYIRQIYKTHLRNDTFKDAQTEEQARLFRGVEGDSSRKGEVFGVENLLKFQDGSFMSDLWKSSEESPSSRRDNTVKVDDLTSALSNLSGEQVVNIGGNSLDEDFHLAATSHSEAGGANAANQQDLSRAGRGDAALQQGNEGVDEEIGGTDVSGGARAAPDQQSGDEAQGNIPNIGEAVGAGNVINHQDLFRADRGNAPRQHDSDDESEEVEVLGGASQNIMEMLGRGGASDDDDDRDGESAPQEASPPKEETRTENVLPKKRRFAGGGSAFVATLETVDESPAQRAYAGADVDVFPGEQECIEASGRQPKKPKKRAAPQKKANGKEESKTSFSANDICLPGYRKKKKKKSNK